ncbi:unnamed protein product, partial [Mesorhabditis belari]|uniref:Fibronectin type-III domain-containing protein n=1 Tax=Mesorhabditis belari TaxID=2138241 RepID=A0AAF3FSI8_9BILA
MALSEYSHNSHQTEFHERTERYEYDSGWRTVPKERVPEDWVIENEVVDPQDAMLNDRMAPPPAPPMGERYQSRNNDSGIPLAPGAPEVLSSGNGEVTLRWEEPPQRADDGPILGYQLQQIWIKQAPFNCDFGGWAKGVSALRQPHQIPFIRRSISVVHMAPSGRGVPVKPEAPEYLEVDGDRDPFMLAPARLRTLPVLG